MFSKASYQLKLKELLEDDSDFIELDTLEENEILWEEDDEDLEESNYNIRRERWNHIRLKWFDHCTKLFHEKMFERQYRMSFSAWDCLIRILKQSLKCNDKFCSTNEPIYLELKVASSLRILYGGTVNDVREIFDISNCHQYYILRHFMDTVLKT